MMFTFSKRVDRGCGTPSHTKFWASVRAILSLLATSKSQSRLSACVWNVESVSAVRLTVSCRMGSCQTDPLVYDAGSLLPISKVNDPTLAVTTIMHVWISHRRWPVIIRHVTACNFALDGFFFLEVGVDVTVGIVLPQSLLPLPTGARHAQAINEFVTTQLQ